MKKHEKKIEEFKYAVNRIIRECKREKYSKLGFSSSLEKNPISDEFLKMCRNKAKEEEINVQIFKLQSVNHYAEALENARDCDAIVLVERYLDSTYKDFDRAIYLLKSIEVDILGVVSVR